MPKPIPTVLAVAVLALQQPCFAAEDQATTPTSGPSFVDDFSGPVKEGRVSERGDWKFDDNIASCESDPELYKKFKNHGPILRWPIQFNDAKIEFEMKPSDCQRVVFTLNGDGHLFRVTLADESPDAKAGTSKVPTRLIAWSTKSSKQNKGDTIKPDGMPDLPAVNGQWVKVALEVHGKQGKIKIGDFHADLEHAALSRPKTNVTLTFAHGSLAVRNFQLTMTE